MAPRTDAQRLIAKAKIMSAGTIPALMIAALLALPGCGGGSDEETASTSAKGTTASAAEEGQSEATSGEGGKQGPGIKASKGPPEPKPTSSQESEATIANLFLSSPVLKTTGEPPLPATYTCDGKDSWPELQWKGIPEDAKELLLFTMNLQPVKGKLYFDWAVGGLDPGLEGIKAGELPAGAVLGKNSAGKIGYSICPPEGKGETYIFALYALPKEALSPSEGFDPRALRDEALAQAGSVGLMATPYKR